MTEEITFDTLDGGSSAGGWIRARDYVGHWVLFIVKNKKEQEGTYGPEMVVRCDFAVVDSKTPVLYEDCWISDPHVVSKLRTGQKIVAKVARGEPKRPGYQGAVFIEQKDGPEYDQAVASARELLTGNIQQDKEILASAKENLRELFQ